MPSMTISDKSASSSSTSSLNGTRQRKTTTNFIERNKQLASTTKRASSTSSKPHHRSSSDVLIKCLNDDETLLNRHRTHHLVGGGEEEVEVAEISIISSHSSIEPSNTALMMTNVEKEAEIVRASENCDRLRSELFEIGHESKNSSMNEEAAAMSAYLVQGEEVVQFDSVYENAEGVRFEYEDRLPLTDQVNMKKFERQRPEIRSQFMKK